MFYKNLCMLVFGLILGLIFSLKTYATTFQVVPLEKLIEDSGSAAEVELKEKKSYMNKMGLIFTDFIFIVNEAYNLDGADLDGEFLKVTMTGGTANGVTSFIAGAPDFSVGEKSFLLLKKIDSRMYISNFTMGKYKIEEHDGKTYYVSTVFPADPDLGKVAKERMIELVKLKFKITQKNEKNSIPPQRVVEENSGAEGPGVFEKRAPAQEQNDSKTNEDGLVAMWIFFALILTSGFTIWWQLRKGVRL